MKDVKMPTSDSYRPYKIESLKEPRYAAAYITAILEEKDPEDELLELALTDVAEALCELNMPPDEAKLHKEKLNELLSKQGSEAIYDLGDWLNALGLKLAVILKEDEET